MGFSKKGGLKTTVRCLLCKVPMQHPALHTLEGQMEEAIYHGLCAACGAAQLFAVWREEEGFASAAMHIDCDFAEMKRFWHAKPIDADDVLCVHNGLKLDILLKIK